MPIMLHTTKLVRACQAAGRPRWRRLRGGRAEVGAATPAAVPALLPAPHLAAVFTPRLSLCSVAGSGQGRDVCGEGGGVWRARLEGVSWWGALSGSDQRRLAGAVDALESSETDGQAVEVVLGVLMGCEVRVSR